MAPRRLPLPLATKTGKGSSGLVSSESLINLYPEANRGQALSPVNLLGIRGQASFATIGGTPRGQFRAGNTHFAIRGETLYTVDSVGAATSRGTIEGSERCDFAYDGNYLHVVADLKSYYADIATFTVAEQTDSDFEQANSCCVVNNLLVVSRQGTGEIAWPSLTNPTAWDGLDFANAETSPDSIVAVRESAQELLIFGEETLEPWRFTGNPDQYFEASGAAAAVKVGTRWRDTIQTVDNAPFWLATNAEGALYVARLNGYTAERISTHAIEANLENAGTSSLDGAFGFSSSEKGHAFYGITLPDHCTWVYDAATQEWAQRLAGSWPLTTPETPQGDWGIRDFCVNAQRKHILGKTDGNLYQLAATSYSQDGGGIVRELTTPPFFVDGLSFTISEIELIVASGVGLATGTTAPTVQMSLSFDGGKTWSDAFTEELGPLGDYGWGVRFNRCGRCPGPKGVSVRWRCTDAVEFTPVQAFITVEVGSR